MCITCEVCGQPAPKENVIMGANSHYYCDDQCKSTIENSDECETCGTILQCDTGYNIRKKIFCDAECMGEYLDNKRECGYEADDFDYTPDCDLYHEC